MSKTAPSCSTRLAAHENCWSVISATPAVLRPCSRTGAQPKVLRRKEILPATFNDYISPVRSSIIDASFTCHETALRLNEQYTLTRGEPLEHPAGRNRGRF